MFSMTTIALIISCASLAVSLSTILLNRSINRRLDRLAATLDPDPHPWLRPGWSMPSLRDELWRQASASTRDAIVEAVNRQAMPLDLDDHI